uniref:Uncharacterized protein n=1 Tax=Timema cristinae TaxID=61476 RepID=A0A7R9CXF1_TIMCR|nr:unnamed protein product [Timema cristinae]
MQASYINKVAAAVSDERANLCGERSVDDDIKWVEWPLGYLLFVALVRYREKNYGSILAKERKSPEGSVCSTFGDSRVESLSDLSECQSFEGDSSDADEEEDFFYRTVMENNNFPTTKQCFLRNNFSPHEEKWKNKEQPVCHDKLKNRFSDEDATSQLKSVSEMKLMMKQRCYGEKANMRNLRKLKESQLRKEKNCKSISQDKLSSKNLVPLNLNPPISRRNQPVEVSSTVPTVEDQRMCTHICVYSVGKTFGKNHHPYTQMGSSPDIPIIGSLVQCESSALDHVAGTS